MARKKAKPQGDSISLAKASDMEVVGHLQKRGYTITKEGLKSGRSFRVSLDRWRGTKYRFGVVADTQLGSRYQQLTALNRFYSLCARRRIYTVFHAGDVFDGEKMYRGHTYELFIHGHDRQLAYGVANYPYRKGITTIMISGNHDQAFWKNAGVDILEHLSRARKDIRYVGADLAFTTFQGIKIALMHGRGGVAYARSYKLQKIIEQLAPEHKPNMLFLGHYHVPDHIPGYRNVEGIQMPCFQAQTPYLAAKGLFPFIAGLIVTIQPDAKGLASVTYEWIPFYEVIKDDF